MFFSPGVPLVCDHAVDEQVKGVFEEQLGETVAGDGFPSVKILNPGCNRFW